MNRFEKSALVAVILVTWYCAWLTKSAWDLYIVRPQVPWTMTALAIAGWLVSNYAPITIALLFWRWSKRARRPWILHLLFLPFAFLAARAGEAMMLHVMKETDFDSTIGAPIMNGILLTPVVVFGYAVALVVRGSARAGESTTPA